MLLAEDDYPLHQTALPLAHVMDGHPNAYDRFWFNGYDEEFYFAFALGLYPNRGVIDAAFSVVQGERQYSVFASDALVGRPTAVGPMRLEIIEPMRVNRVVVEAPDHGLRCDLTYTRRTAISEEPRQTMHDGARLVHGRDARHATGHLERMDRDAQRTTRTAGRTSSARRTDHGACVRSASRCPASRVTARRNSPSSGRRCTSATAACTS